MSRTVSRRQVLAGMAGAAAMGFPMVNLGRFRLEAASPGSYSGRTIDLVGDSLVLDMLAPLKIDLTPAFHSSPLSDQDAADFRASGITGFHHAFGIGGPGARENALSFMAAWQGFVGRNSELFTLVDRVGDLERARLAGKCAVIIGVQNAEHFHTPEDVKFFHQLGQRCSQLTYNSQNRLGSGSTDRVDGGVSDFGAAIIQAMNEVGVLVDVSHCGDRTTLDAIELSRGPIAITHSNCRALVDHPRLKTDEAIRALAAKGGVMGITGVRMFVRATEPTTVEHIVDHIDHVAALVGIEHVGIGSDADLNGYDAMPADQYERLKASFKESYAFRDKIDTDGFNHPRKIYDLTEALVRRKYSDASITAILGLNFHRLMAETWA